MKKLSVIIMTVIVAATCIFSFAGCATVKNGSKIQKVKVELEIYNAAGEVERTTDINMELYLNFAPDSTEHIKKLISDGFYNGVCISNIQTNWLEFGAYSYNGNELAAKNYSYGTVEGEFLSGNRLSVTKGAIVFKHDYDSDDENVSKYDTAKSTLAVCFSASASTTFDHYYCVLGMVCNDDGNSNASDTFEQKSSIEKLSSLTEYKSVEDDNKNTVVTYYYEKENQYYTKWTDESGDTHYAKGASIGEELEGDELDAYNDLYKENKNYFLVVPCVKLVIKSMSLVK